MRLECPCGRAEAYCPERWTRPRRLSEGHFHGVQGAVWKTTHRRCGKTKFVTDAMGRTLESVWGAAERAILRAS